MNRPPRSAAIETLLDATLSSSKSDGYIERLKARDDAALTRLYEDHVTYIDRLLYRVLGPDPNHQDLVQDVFINAIESLIRFRGDESSLRPWLAKIAVHRARRELRYRKVRRFIGLSPAGELPDLPATDNPELQAQLQRVFEIIDRLGTDDQLVFSLHVIHQMKLEEVAETLDVSLSTVKRRYKRARERFERRMADTSRNRGGPSR